MENEEQEHTRTTARAGFGRSPNPLILKIMICMFGRGGLESETSGCNLFTAYRTGRA